MQSFLQERFKDIVDSSTIAPGKVLKFNDNNELECVVPVVEGMQAQIVATASVSIPASGETISSVTCTGQGVTIVGILQNGKYIFNIPTLGAYTITATSSTGKIGTQDIIVDEIKRYLTAVVVETEVSSTLEDNDWSLIKVVTQIGSASSYWNVGDRKAITFSGTLGTCDLTGTYYAYIIGFDHNAQVESDGQSTITFQFGFDAASDGKNICFVDTNYTQECSTPGSFCAQLTNTPSSCNWVNSNIRLNVCQKLFDYLSGNDSLSLANNIRTVSKYTLNNSSVSSTYDSVFLLSEKEVTGSTTYAYSDEGNYQEQYSYYVTYSTPQYRIKYKYNSTATVAHWWLRSPRRVSDGNTIWTANICITNSGNPTNMTVCTRSLGVAPAFVIG